jgi:hypothetical protein
VLVEIKVVETTDVGVRDDPDYGRKEAVVLTTSK